MANRLLSTNFPVSVYNRNREKTKALAEVGAHFAGSPREAAAGAEIVISMVADDVASRAVWLGENGALSGAPSGSVLIESSTLTVGWIKELASVAAQRGCDLLDAPVTGTKPHAESGELLFLVGGSERALAAARPVLSNGSGSLMKLINNFLAAVQAVSFGEALALIKAGGLNPEKAMAILTEGVPGSPMVKRVASRAAAGDFTPHFLLRLMAKDIGYALEEASQRHVSLQTAAATLAVFRQAIADGYGEKDFTSVIESLSLHAVTS